MFFHLSINHKIPPPEYPRAYQDRLKIMEEQRRELQAKHEEEYQKALDEIKDDIREKEGDDIIENMKEDIRQWFNTEKVHIIPIYRQLFVYIHHHISILLG